MNSKIEIKKVGSLCNILKQTLTITIIERNIKVNSNDIHKLSFTKEPTVGQVKIIFSENFRKFASNFEFLLLIY